MDELELENKALKEQIKVLESLKSDSKDWKTIDDKVSKISMEITDKNFLFENDNQVKKIKTFLETYKDDDNFGKNH